MSGSKHASYGDGAFHAPMYDDERHEARLDFDRAEEGDDAAKLRWIAKWGRRVADQIWRSGK